MKPKYITFYLPQFHQVPENDKWWGKGYTEWNAVKAAKPLFTNHIQPKKPTTLGYYDLLFHPTIQEDQAKLAQDFGIYGFCYYHYWLGNGKLMLEKPAERMLKNKNITLPFCFCWANHDWTRNWYGGDSSLLLLKQNYNGKEDIKKHVQYLLPFFQDERYITVDNKLVFVIHHVSKIPNFNKYAEMYREEVYEKTKKELYIISGFNDRYRFWENNSLECDAHIGSSMHVAFEKINLSLLNRIKNKLGLYPFPRVFEYPELVKIVKGLYDNYPNFIPLAFPNWDNSPRLGKEQGELIQNDNPQLFKEMLIAAKKATVKRQSDDFVFIQAWNEWGEGNYLEPDELIGNANLEAILQSI